MRVRSRCIFSASDSSAPDPTFLLSTSIRDTPVRVSVAHRSNRSFSSARLRKLVRRAPSGDSLSARGCCPDSSGLANTRASVSAPGCTDAAGAVGALVAWAGGSAAIAAPHASIDADPVSPIVTPASHVRIPPPSKNRRRRPARRYRAGEAGRKARPPRARPEPAIAPIVERVASPVRFFGRQGFRAHPLGRYGDRVPPVRHAGRTRCSGYERIEQHC